MEAAASDDQSASAVVTTGSSKLRYPLRSASKSKDAKPLASADPPVTSVSKRARSSPAVSKSVSTLDLSGKPKSGKPPRRLSISTKPGASLHPAAVGSITPIPESRSNRPNLRGKSGTPVTEVSKSLARRKFSVISSVSYWLTQIKLSENASKHAISLGFFKLALESGCEPLSRVREELKSYITRHNLVVELGDSVKDLMQSYNIVDELENLSLSDSPKEVHNSDNDVPDVPSGVGNLKPKSLNADTAAVVTSKKDITEKKPATDKRATNNRNKAKSVPSKDGKGNNAESKTQKIKTVTKKTSSPKEPKTVAGSITDHSPEKEAASDEEKENMAW